MNWNKGFTAKYYLKTVDPITWRDMESKQFEAGSLSISDTDLRESANIDCVNYKPQEEWIRIWLDARQGENIEHVALFTGLAITPKENWHGRVAKYPIDCYSVLMPAEDVWLQRGWYAPVGVKCGTIIRQLLSVSPAPLVIHGETPELKDTIVAEDMENHLSMTEKILNAMNWRLRINGMGEMHLMPKPTEPVAYIGGENDIIGMDIDKSSDFYKCPNVFMAIDDDVVGIARDDSNGEFSTKTRGREIWNGEMNCDLTDNETVAEYALRKLKELQSKSIEINYARRFLPEVRTGDMINIHYPAQKIDGNFIVRSQSIELTHGAEVSEVSYEL